MKRKKGASRQGVVLCGTLLAAIIFAAVAARGRLQARANDRWQARRAGTLAQRIDEGVDTALVHTDRVLDATALVGETMQALLEGPSEGNAAGP